MTTPRFDSPADVTAWAKVLTDQGGWAALDCETTGLDAKAEAIAIAIVAQDGTVLLDSLVRPSTPLPPYITKMTGITEAMLRGAPTFRDLWSTLLPILERHAIIAYNVDFDTRILAQTAARYGLTLPARVKADAACAMKAYAIWSGNAQNVVSSTRNVKLTEALQHLGITEQHIAHSALPDAVAVHAMIYALANATVPTLTSPQSAQETPGTTISTRVQRRITLEDALPVGQDNSLKKHISDHDWDTLRREVYRQAGYICEQCGKNGTLYAHEVWELDTKQRRLRLARMEALCKTCHDLKYLWLQRKRAAKDPAIMPALIAHYTAVNGGTASDFQAQARRSTRRHYDLQPYAQVDPDYGEYARLLSRADWEDEDDYDEDDSSEWEASRARILVSRLRPIFDARSGPVQIVVGPNDTHVIERTPAGIYAAEYDATEGERSRLATSTLEAACNHLAGPMWEFWGLEDAETVTLEVIDGE